MLTEPIRFPFVRIQLPDDVIDAFRLPETIRSPNRSEYALAKAFGRFLVIAQIPGAPEWRALNAAVRPVGNIGKRLLAANSVKGPLSSWCNVHVVTAPYDLESKPKLTIVRMP